MNKSKQLTLLDCGKQGSKRCRISSTSDSEERDDVILCEAQDILLVSETESDSVEDSANTTRRNTTSQSEDTQDSHQEPITQMDVQGSYIVDCSMHSGPDVVNENELEIAENESVVISDQRSVHAW